MASESFGNLQVDQSAGELSDAIREIVIKWNAFAKDTVGRQLVRAADRVGANSAEKAGRKSYADNKRFVATARGSLFETRHFLRRAHKRKLLAPEETSSLQKILSSLPRSLNAYFNAIENRAVKNANNQ